MFLNNNIYIILTEVINLKSNAIYVIIHNDHEEHVICFVIQLYNCACERIHSSHGGNARRADVSSFGLSLIFLMDSINITVFSKGGIGVFTLSARAFL